jgi:hypothetical protein
MDVCVTTSLDGFVNVYVLRYFYGKIVSLHICHDIKLCSLVYSTGELQGNMCHPSLSPFHTLALTPNGEIIVHNKR